jgi:hypothetical protein
MSRYRDYGEIVIVASREEAARAADVYPSSILRRNAPMRNGGSGLRNYGSSFLGEKTTVAFDDKTSSHHARRRRAVHSVSPKIPPLLGVKRT